MVRYDPEQAACGERYVEDRRAPRRGGRAGGTGGLPVGRAGGLGAVIIAVIAMLLGGNALTDGGVVDAPIADPDAGTVEYMQFLLDDIQVVWDQCFDEAGLQYPFTTLVIFDDAVSTGCGHATSAVGPFYCPAPGDDQVYIDLGFYEDLSTRFGAPGDFAQAYVIAHEVGHHIRSATGISDRVRQAQLEEGDIEEILRAAAAVGDDRIQSSAGVDVDPHTWTHGSAEARQSWFTTGFRSGDPEQCDTFVASSEKVGL